MCMEQLDEKGWQELMSKNSDDGSDLDRYDRAKRDGVVDARLDGHDKALDSLAGSVDRFASEIGGLSKAVQRLGDQAISDGATRIATAAALKDERDMAAAALRNTRERSDEKWTPWQRLAALLGSAATVLTAVYLVTHPHG